MRLVPITANDEDLAVRLECDPELMREIGGPRPEEDVRASHRRRLELMDRGETRMCKVLAGAAAQVVGTIGIWRIEWQGPGAWEIGWFVLPEHQGRGVATRAAALIVAEARKVAEIRSVHAFPSVSNGASNAIARKLGMLNQGEFDNEGFAGILRCNHWRLDLG